MEPGASSGVRKRDEVNILRRAIQAQEQRLLGLQERMAWQGPTQEALVASAEVIAEIRQLFRRVQEERQRRRLSFAAETKLGMFEQWCKWLVRRAVEECVFHVRLHLEQALRSVLPAHAHEIYGRLTELEQLGREASAMPDHALDELPAWDLTPLSARLDGFPPRESRYQAPRKDSLLRPGTLP